MSIVSFLFGIVTAVAVESIAIIAFCVSAYNEHNKRK